MRLITIATTVMFSVFLCWCSFQEAAAESTESSPLRINLKGTADLWGQPVGSLGMLTFTMPNNLAEYREAILFIQADDLDSPEEATAILNDSVTLDWPESIFGETAGRSGCIPLKVKDLKPGFNKIDFVFKSTLNGSTSGYSILAAEVQLFKKLTDKQKARLARESTTWGKPVNWNEPTIHDAALEQRSEPDMADYLQDEPLKRWSDSSGDWTLKAGMDLFDIEDRDIYRSPEEPSHLLWSHITKGKDGIFKIGFSQLTGNPGLESSYRPVHGRNEETWPNTANANNMRLGPDDAVTTTTSKQVFLYSADNGVTWENGNNTSIEFIPEEDPGGVGSYYTNLRCRDGRLMKNPGPNEYQVLVKEKEGIANLTDAGLSKVLLGVNESLDNGKTWSQTDWVTPEGCDPDIVKGSTEEAAMIELDDGRILTIQRVHPRHDGPIQFYLTRVGPGKYKASKPILLPMPYSGMPELKRVSDGTIWYWGHDSHWFTYDDGASWHELPFRFSCYYGRMVEGANKTMVCTTMNNIGDSPYPHWTDSNIRLYRFSWRKSGTLYQNNADQPNVLITRKDTVLRDLHIKADMRVDGATGLAFHIQPDGKSYHCLAVVMPGSEVYEKWFMPKGQEENQAVYYSIVEEKYKEQNNTIREPMLVLAKKEGDKITVLRSTSLKQRDGFPKGSWVRLQLKVSGGLIQGAINSDPPTYIGIHVTNSGSGAIGLFTDVSTGAFKNIEIWKKPQMIRQLWD